ncbi:killer cell lectin-like receptor subfamily G member 2 [Tachyglossus aculeatus]|uniref:killer cell lectin-like receptor subfamily G member 2 n=1 Tax=Tachyglossus aculeatus TaxID=9261 RepID=UPI0018F69D89|nr:killer cell lectin-like receptor subfamily G member 2 [Tachyglossus aculeatus]
MARVILRGVLKYQEPLLRRTQAQPEPRNGPCLCVRGCWGGVPCIEAPADPVQWGPVPPRRAKTDLSQKSPLDSADGPICLANEQHPVAQGHPRLGQAQRGEGGPGRGGRPIGAQSGRAGPGRAGPGRTGADGRPAGRRTQQEAAQPRTPMERPEEALPAPGPPRPPFLRVPPPSLGYGSFRGRGSPSPDPAPAPAPASELSRREGPAPAPGGELILPLSPGLVRELSEPGPGARGPLELRVDVRVRPAAGPPSPAPSPSPSPTPTTRFFSVPVPVPGPDSPTFSSRGASTPTPSPGSTWGRGPHPLAGLEGRGAAREGPGGCRCRELGPEDKDGAKALPPAWAHEEKLSKAIALIGLPMYMKSLRWALALMALLFAVAVITITALASRAPQSGKGCRPCSAGWLWAEDRCYFYSSDAQDWAASHEFCSAHGAALAVLTRPKDFLGQFQAFGGPYWLGLRRSPTGWRWEDGSPLPPDLLPEMGGDDEPQGLGCGGLEDGKIVALDCASPTRWICVRTSQ